MAEAIVALAERPARERFVGLAGPLIVALHTVAPALYERLAAHRVARDHFGREAAAPTDGNLFEAQPSWTTTGGGWLPRVRGRRLPLLAVVVAAAVPVIIHATRRRAA